MVMETEFRLTNRMVNIIQNTEKFAQSTDDKVIVPLHLLLSCLQEKGGAMGELNLKCNIDTSVKEVSPRSSQNDKVKSSKYFRIPISEEVEHIFEVAIETMRHYNQIFLNEGHLLKALIITSAVKDYLSEVNKERIITLGTTSRDMITHLGSYNFPKIEVSGIRKAAHKDKDMLIKFVEDNFSDEWANTIRSGFLINEPPLYVALDEKNNYIGFAAYDLFQNKKGYFGPMGVLPDNRGSGVGYSLLHHCLSEMKLIGYEYAVIGGAGPIEFYEIACNAVVIPTPFGEGV